MIGEDHFHTKRFFYSQYSFFIWSVSLTLLWYVKKTYLYHQITCYKVLWKVFNIYINLQDINSPWLLWIFFFPSFPFLLRGINKSQSLILWSFYIMTIDFMTIEASDKVHCHNEETPQYDFWLVYGFVAPLVTR